MQGVAALAWAASLVAFCGAVSDGESEGGGSLFPAPPPLAMSLAHAAVAGRSMPWQATRAQGFLSPRPRRKTVADPVPLPPPKRPTRAGVSAKDVDASTPVGAILKETLGLKEKYLSMVENTEKKIEQIDLQIKHAESESEGLSKAIKSTKDSVATMAAEKKMLKESTQEAKAQELKLVQDAQQAEVDRKKEELERKAQYWKQWGTSKKMTAELSELKERLEKLEGLNSVSTRLRRLNQTWQKQEENATRYAAEKEQMAASMPKMAKDIEALHDKLLSISRARNALKRNVDQMTDANEEMKASLNTAGKEAADPVQDKESQQEPQYNEENAPRVATEQEQMAASIPTMAEDVAALHDKIVAISRARSAPERNVDQMTDASQASLNTAGEEAADTVPDKAEELETLRKEESGLQAELQAVQTSLQQHKDSIAALDGQPAKIAESIRRVNAENAKEQQTLIDIGKEIAKNKVPEDGFTQAMPDPFMEVPPQVPEDGSTEASPGASMVIPPEVPEDGSTEAMPDTSMEVPPQVPEDGSTEATPGASMVAPPQVPEDGSTEAMPDTSMEVTPQVPEDGSTEATPGASMVAPPQVLEDWSTEAMPDTSMEVPEDGSTEAVPDTSMEVLPEVPEDGSSEAMPDTSMEVPPEVPEDGSTEAVPDTSMEVGADPGQ